MSWQDTTAQAAASPERPGLPLTAGLALGLLQPVKGAIVGWQWAHYMHGFDPAAQADRGQNHDQDPDQDREAGR